MNEQNRVMLESLGIHMDFDAFKDAIIVPVEVEHYDEPGDGYGTEIFFDDQSSLIYRCEFIGTPGPAMAIILPYPKEEEERK